MQVISAFLLVSIVFVPIGVASLIASRKVMLSVLNVVIMLIVLYNAEFNFQFVVSVRLLKLFLGMNPRAYQIMLLTR